MEVKLLMEFSIKILIPLASFLKIYIFPVWTPDHHYKMFNSIQKHSSIFFWKINCLFMYKIIGYFHYDNQTKVKLVCLLLQRQGYKVTERDCHLNKFCIMKLSKFHQSNNEFWYLQITLKVHYYDQLTRLCQCVLVPIC